MYPIVDFPGWGDDRHCETGLWSMADGQGHRGLHKPLAEELLSQQDAIEETRSKVILNVEVAATAFGSSLPRLVRDEMLLDRTPQGETIIT